MLKKNIIENIFEIFFEIDMVRIFFIGVRILDSDPGSANRINYFSYKNENVLSKKKSIK